MKSRTLFVSALLLLLLSMPAHLHGQGTQTLPEDVDPPSSTEGSQQVTATGAPQMGVERRPNYEVFRMTGLIDQDDISYSGDLNLSIPLVTIPGRREHDFEIKISYSSALSQRQLASWVGLGWNLDLGGLERSIVGRMDDQVAGLWFPTYNLGWDNLPGYRAEMVGRVNSSHSAIGLDSLDQADMYRITMDGVSTELFPFSQNTTLNDQVGVSSFMAPQWRPWFVSALWCCNDPISYFQALREDGTAYTFGAGSGIADYAWVEGKGAGGTVVQNLAFPYRWNLTSIDYPDGSRTRFHYNNHNYGTSGRYARKNETIMIDRSAEYGFGVEEYNLFGSGAFDNPGLSQKQIYFAYSSPDTVFTDTHFAVFKSRRTVGVDSTLRNSRLDTIIVYELGSLRELKRVTFSYANVGNDISSWREEVPSSQVAPPWDGERLNNGQLTLKSITIRNGTNPADAMPPYVFTYYQNPRVDPLYLTERSMSDQYFPGHISNSVFGTAWRLKDITLPSGAKVGYTYEALNTGTFTVRYDPESYYAASPADPWSHKSEPRPRLKTKTVTDPLGPAQTWTYSYGDAVFDPPSRLLSSGYLPRVHLNWYSFSPSDSREYYKYFRACQLGHRWVEKMNPDSSVKRVSYISSYRGPGYSLMESQPDSIIASYTGVPIGGTIMKSLSGRRGLVWKEETNSDTTIFKYSFSQQGAFRDLYSYSRSLGRGTFRDRVQQSSIWARLDSVISTKDGVKDTIAYFYNPTRREDPGTPVTAGGDGLLTQKVEKGNNHDRVTSYFYAHEKYLGMDSLAMFTQPYSITVRKGALDDEKKEWTTWAKVSGRWLPSQKWEWNALPNDLTAPDDPTATNAVAIATLTYDSLGLGNVIREMDANGNLVKYFYGDSTNRFANTSQGLSKSYITGIEKPHSYTPAAFTLSAPSHNATLQPLSGVLGWNYSMFATSYDVYLGTTNPPTSLLAQDITGTSTSYAGLQPNTIYYWRVTAKNQNGSIGSSNSPWQFTTTNSPVSFVLLSPANNSATGSSGTLRWRRSPNATAYDVFLNVGSPPTTLVASNIPDTIYTFSGLALNTAYSWSVTAKNQYGTLVASNAPWNFTPTNLPLAFDLSTPTNGQTNVNNYTLRWTASQNATAYDLYLSTTSPPTTVVRSNITTTSVYYDGLATNTRYYWNIVAKNAFGNRSSSTGPWNFRTGTALPLANSVDSAAAESESTDATTEEENMAIVIDEGGGGGGGGSPPPPPTLFLRTSYKYDHFGKVIQEKEENSDSTNYIYDKLGRLVTIKGPTSQTIHQYAYLFASPLSSTNPNLITEKAYASSADSILSQTFYDGAGYEIQRQLFLNSEDIITHKSYDVLRRLQKRYRAYQKDQGGTQRHKYDSGFDLSARTYYPESGFYPYSMTTYEKTPGGRVANEFFADTIFSNSNLATNHYQRYSYGPNGGGLYGYPNFRTLRKTSLIDENGAEVSTFRDKLGRTVATVVDSAGLNLVTWSEYDVNDRPLRVFSPKHYPPPPEATASTQKNEYYPTVLDSFELSGLASGTLKTATITLTARNPAAGGSPGPGQPSVLYEDADAEPNSVQAPRGITLYYTIKQFRGGVLIASTPYEYLTAVPPATVISIPYQCSIDADRVRLVTQILYGDQTYYATVNFKCVSASVGDLSYGYNSRGHVLSRFSSDKGTTNYRYDKNGNLRFEQNPDQALRGQFTYRKYDRQNRIVEIGEMTGSFALSDSTSSGTPDNDFPVSGGSVRVKNTYDLNLTNDPTLTSARKLLGRLFSVETVADGMRDTTYFSYDEFGQVEWQVHRFAGITPKKLTYQYDLLGKITKMTYENPSSTQENTYFFYEYDAAGRLARCYSGTYSDGSNKFKDAEYSYAPSGQVSRMLLGSGQGVDYRYNERDWLAQINHPSLTSALDPGGDGANGIPLDRFGARIGYNTIGEIGQAQSSSAQYNGNLSWMTYNMSGVNFSGPFGTTSHVGQSYSYDNVNRLRTSDFGYHAAGAWRSTNSYDITKLTYDKNGNMDTVKRYGHNGNLMDDMKYNYIGVSNRLDYVTDLVPSGSFASDIDNQLPLNYVYDGRGELVKNVQSGIDSSLFDYRGLPTYMRRSGNVVRYRYDANGDRIYKTESNGMTSYYIRDYKGRTIAVLNNLGYLSMINLHGNDQLGYMLVSYEGPYGAPQMVTTEGGGGSPEMVADDSPAGGEGVGMAFYGARLDSRVYYLKDQAGTIKMSVDPWGTIVSYDDYDPYGAVLENRSGNFGISDTRYKFTGKERDFETGYDYFGARYYDPRIGRWLSVDPLQEKLPGWSPYNYALSNPVKLNDPDGRMPQAVLGALVGGASEAAAQVLTHMVVDHMSPVDAVKHIDKSDVAVAAGVGAATGGLGSLKTVGRVGKLLINVTGNVAEGAGQAKLNNEEYSADEAVIDASAGVVADGFGEAVGDKVQKNVPKELKKAERKATNALENGKPRKSQVDRAAKAQQKVKDYGKGGRAQTATETGKNFAKDRLKNTPRQREQDKKE